MTFCEIRGGGIFLQQQVLFWGHYPSKIKFITNRQIKSNSQLNSNSNSGDLLQIHINNGWWQKIFWKKIAWKVGQVCVRTDLAFVCVTFI